MASHTEYVLSIIPFSTRSHVRAATETTCRSIRDLTHPDYPAEEVDRLVQNNTSRCAHDIKMTLRAPCAVCTTKDPALAMGTSENPPPSSAADNKMPSESKSADEELCCHIPNCDCNNSPTFVKGAEMFVAVLHRSTDTVVASAPSLSSCHLPFKHPPSAEQIALIERTLSASSASAESDSSSLFVQLPNNTPGVLVTVGGITENRLRKLFVHPSFNRLGIGSLIVSHLEKCIRTRGYPAVRCDSSLTAFRMGFYQSLGYTAIDMTKPDAPPQPHGAVAMIKTFAE